VEWISTSFTINAAAFLFLDPYHVAGEKQGIPADRLRPVILNDVLKEFFTAALASSRSSPRCTWSPIPFKYCSRTMPRADHISVCGCHIRESGANAVQELAFPISNAIEYVEQGVERGTPIDAFVPASPGTWAPS
jgi:methylmalonyl-CoA mutase N-terminal domain/subunit